MRMMVLTQTSMNIDDSNIDYSNFNLSTINVVNSELTLLWTTSYQVIWATTMNLLIVLCLHTLI